MFLYYLGFAMVSNIRQMKVLADEEDGSGLIDIGQMRGRRKLIAFQIPSWMRLLHQTVQEWLTLLPEVCPRFRPFCLPILLFELTSSQRHHQLSEMIGLLYLTCANLF